MASLYRQYTGYAGYQFEMNVNLETEINKLIQDNILEDNKIVELSYLPNPYVAIEYSTRNMMQWYNLKKGKTLEYVAKKIYYCAKKRLVVMEGTCNGRDRSYVILTNNNYKPLEIKRWVNNNKTEFLQIDLDNSLKMKCIAFFTDKQGVTVYN